MKKLFLGLIAIAMFSLFGFAKINHNPIEINNNKNEIIGKIHIKFHGGSLCWLPGSACEGEITIEWRPTAPSDANVEAPAGYQLISMETSLYGKSSQTFAERSFNNTETSDGSTIYIPAQEGKYSKKLDAFVLYAKTIK